MKHLLFGIGLVFLLVAAYWSVRFVYLLHVSKGLVASAVPYTLNSKNSGPSILVVGDSTGVGVGAGEPGLSVPGRVSAYVHAATVENHAVSGAVVTDLPAQFAQAQRMTYSLILVQIGGNDIVRFHDAHQAAEQVLKSIPMSLSDHVIVISAGDVGTSRLFPPPLRTAYTKENQKYHSAFTSVLSSPRTTYVNLALGPGNDLFTTDPDTYFAADQFHPSGAGYGIWFNALKPALDSLNLR